MGWHQPSVAPTDLSALGDVSLSSPTSGDLLEYQISGKWSNSAGPLALKNTSPITTLSGGYTIAAGTVVTRPVTALGSTLWGLNPDLTDETGLTTSINSQMIDGAFLQAGLRAYFRSLRLAEQGDPVDLIAGRWGPNNGYPYATKTGMNTNQAIGSIRWMPAVNAFGATPDVTPGGSLQATAASIGVTTVEVPRDTTGGGVYAVGSRMAFQIAPVGGTAVEAVRLNSTGHLQVGTQAVGQTDSAVLQVWSEAVGTKVAVFRAFASQTADVFDVQDSNGVSFFRIAAGGGMFYDQAAAQLSWRNQSSAGNAIFQTQVTGDTSGFRYILRASGAQEWGAGGSSATDLQLLRGNAGVMSVKALGSVGTAFRVQATATNSATDILIDARNSSGNSVGGFQVDGKMSVVAANKQTTVGAAGGASALPATPTGYFLINVAGTTQAVPYYAAT